MLLLVLILVVIAFGLLVVALLSGSVLWAWVSVGVSVVAAVVLLADWLQRRAAVKAGAAPAFEPAAGAPAPLANAPMGPRPATGRPPMADMDPATEILSIVPSSSRGGDEPESPTVMAQAPRSPDLRPADGQQTVVMPAVQPSGSPPRPPGAELSIIPLSAISSPNVTSSEVDRQGPDLGPDAPKTPSGVAEAAAAGAAAAASAVSGTSGTEKPDDAPGERAPSLQKVAGAPATPGEEPGVEKPAEKAPSGNAPEAGPTSTPVRLVPEVPDPDAPAPVAAADGAATAGADMAGGSAVAAEAAGSGRPGTDPDAEPTVKVEAHTNAPAEPASTTAAPTEYVDLFAAAPVGQPSEPVSSEDAPEERRDPVAAEIVSGLDDEVVVVDEQPRYHVTGCRALVSVVLIPLPVREAVELGFTPCGWCSPDRTLAGRHQTASR